MAVNRAVPRTAGLVKTDLREGLGQNVERRRLGRNLYYRRDDLMSYIKALIDSMEPIDGLDPKMVALSKKTKHEVKV